MSEVKLGKILNAVTATTVSNWAGPNKLGQKTFQAYVAGSGAVTATLYIEVTNDKNLSSSAVIAHTFNLSGNGWAVDGVGNVAEGWGYYRARLSAISGTNATLTLVSGE